MNTILNNPISYNPPNNSNIRSNKRKNNSLVLNSPTDINKISISNKP